jgi:putative transposase
VEYAGAHYHVINRGNYRRNLFDDEGAGEAFERTLNEAAKSHPGKALLAAALKRSSAASNHWIAERLNMGQSKSISVIVARWNRLPKSEQRVRALLLNVAT